MPKKENVSKVSAKGTKTTKVASKKEASLLTPSVRKVAANPVGESSTLLTPEVHKVVALPKTQRLGESAVASSSKTVVATSSKTGGTSTAMVVRKEPSSLLKVASQKDTLMHSLISFFHKRDHIEELLPIIEGESNISLRILDWFVTNYSKKHGVHYYLGDGKRFMVYVSYKAQLKAYQKKNFDPFCRRERIKFIVHGGKEVITTVGQLNFFRWAIDNKILKYITDHYEDIEKDMNDSLKNIYKKKDDEVKRRKRRQLSVSAVKTVNKHNTSIVVSFN